MPAFKGASFQDRQKSTAEAKKALLEKFKARPAADDPVVIEREAQRREIAAAREARAAEREARLRAEAEEHARREAEQHAALQARLKADEAAREAADIAEAERLKQLRQDHRQQDRHKQEDDAADSKGERRERRP